MYLEHNVSEVTFHRWKKQFGQMDLNEAKRLEELERENGELKKILAPTSSAEVSHRSQIRLTGAQKYLTHTLYGFTTALMP